MSVYRVLAYMVLGMFFSAISMGLGWDIFAWQWWAIMVLLTGIAGLIEPFVVGVFKGYRDSAGSRR